MEFKLDELKQLIDDQSTDIKGKVSEISKSYKDLDGIIEKLNTEVETHGEALSETKSSYTEQVEKVSKLEAAFDDLAQKMVKLPGTEKVFKSVGQMAAESEAAKQYKGGVMELCEYAGPLFRKDITADVTDPYPQEPFRRPGIYADPEQPLTIRDLLTVIPTGASSIEWAQEKSFDNQAGPQATQGADKPKSDLTFEKKSSPVETLAHWMAASRQILADVPALRGFIDSRLRYGLKLVEETQLLFGDGTGGNLNGLMPQATTTAVAVSAGAGDTQIDALRKVITEATLANYPVTAMVLNPSDWADIELTKDANKGYIFANPVNQATPRIWGRRVVESQSMTVDNFLVGAFGLGATLWDRELINVRVAEQHANFFIQNMVAILMEERLALTVERPKAFIKGVFATVVGA